jgi:hypothetical protein
MCCREGVFSPLGRSDPVRVKLFSDSRVGTSTNAATAEVPLKSAAAT